MVWFPKPFWSRPSGEEWKSVLNQWFSESETNYYMHQNTWFHEMQFYFVDETSARRFVDRATQLWPALTEHDMHVSKTEEMVFDQNADCWHRISDLQWCSNCDEFVSAEWGLDEDEATCVDCGESTITTNDMTPKEVKKRVDAWIKAA